MHAGADRPPESGERSIYDKIRDPPVVRVEMLAFLSSRGLAVPRRRTSQRLRLDTWPVELTVVAIGNLRVREETGARDELVAQCEDSQPD